MSRDLETFAEQLQQSWSPATSTLWTLANPARGQCGVTALVVQDHLGGAIVKTMVDGRWHFYNLVGGSRVDFTACQFDEPLDYQDIPSNRTEAFSDTNADQYGALSARIGSLQARG